jgi:enoyl-CoA hydratase/carnithine racemase
MTEHESAGVRVASHGPVIRITLDRPERHNALDEHDLAALRRALEEISEDETCRAVLLTGRGDRTFCAGASLEALERGTLTPRDFDGLTNQLARLPRPTVCALNGNAYGGGAELALCCDFRVGTPELRIRVPAARLGVCYPLGGLGRWVRRLGPAAASRILLAAEELEADELLSIGYLTHRVPAHVLAREAEALSSRLAEMAPLAVRAMKRLMGDLADGTVDASEAERLLARVEASADLREGLRAAREGREPDFEGR